MFAGPTGKMPVLQIRYAANELEEFVEIDVATGDHGDDRSASGLATQSRCHRQRSRTFGDDARFFREQSHCSFRFFQANDNRTVRYWPHSFPHSRKNAFPARTIDKRLLPLGEYLWRLLGKRQRTGRRCFRLCAPHFYLRFERFERATNSGEQTTTSNGRGYRHHIGRVLENLQSERRIPGHKILVVERVNECSFDSREGTILHRLPRSIERDRN